MPDEVRQVSTHRVPQRREPHRARVSTRNDMSKSLADSNKHVRLRSSKLGETENVSPSTSLSRLPIRHFSDVSVFPASLRRLVADP